MSSGPGSVEGLPRPGDVLAGKYRVEATIGAGGMGVVMAATDMTLGRAVAIKLLAPARAKNREAMARFVREARAAAMIASEHVVRVFELGELPHGVPFIVMEHLRGSDLGQTLEARGALPIDEACDDLLEACDALAEAHARGIVHRDSKPQNLFVVRGPDGRASLKVLDFGISKAAETDEPQHLTSTDTVMGTPLYMSPEQVRSLKNLDARADVWALGAILFELLTGSPPFEAPSASALCAMIVMDPPTPLRKRRPAAPPELEAAILRCLEKDPARRYADVAALADALAPFASARGRACLPRIAKVAATTVPTNPMAPPIHPLATAPTTRDGWSRPEGGGPPLAGAAPSVSNLPPPGAAPPPVPALAPPRRAVPVVALVAGAAVLGLGGLAAVGTVGWVLLAPGASGAATQDASAAASAVLPIAPPTATATATATATGTATGTPHPTPPPPPPPPPVKVDAAAPPVVDAGRRPNPPPDDHLARRQQAEGRCNSWKPLVDRDQQLRNGQPQFCDPACSWTPGTAAPCERTMCRRICEKLHDDNCIRRLEDAERRNPVTL